MGIGRVVAAVFGSITLLQIHWGISRALHQMLEERTRSVAASLVASLERPMSTGDLLAVNQRLQRVRRMFPDVRYIIVRDARGRVVSHTFERAIPHDLDWPQEQSGDSEMDLDVFTSAEGLVFNVTYPILNGHAGTLQLGVTGQMMTQELTVVIRSVIWGLALCAMIGAGLALLLTHILTHPIHHGSSAESVGCSRRGVS